MPPLLHSATTVSLFYFSSPAEEDQINAVSSSRKGQWFFIGIFLQLPPQLQNGDTNLGEMEQKLAVPYSDEPLAPSDAQSQCVWQKKESDFACLVNYNAHQAKRHWHIKAVSKAAKILLNKAFSGFINCINSGGKCLVSGVLQTWWNLTYAITLILLFSKELCSHQVLIMEFFPVQPQVNTPFFHAICNTLDRPSPLIKKSIDASLFQQHKHNIDDESLLIIGCWYLLLLWRF